MKEKLSPEAQARIQQRLNLTNWEEKYPITTDRLTAHRAARETITPQVLAEIATEKARQEAEQRRQAQAEVARYPQGGGRYGH